jgi:hypothetical protein
MDRDCLDFAQARTVAVRLCIVAMLLCAAVAGADFQGSTHLMPFEEDTINYNNAEATDPVALLQKRIESGKSRLKHDDDYGWLMGLLEELSIPKSSQMLVFSKTSLQRERISPKSPRAIFFNDNVYVGFIPGAPLIEISAADPKLGGVFYTLDQTTSGKPRITRNNQCLECHASAKTMGVPGHLVRSFATDEQGIADINTGISQVNHRTPFEERWGGWYVTGTHGKQPHRGNLVGKNDFERHATEPAFGGNVKKLSGYFDVKPYLSKSSDVVALMVLEHQTHMHNFVTRLNYEATIALRQYGHVRYMKNAVEAFLKYMLFTEEARLTEPVTGTSTFARDFAGCGPRDKQGRSLRELDLETRLFKYPCSYLIYSDAFEALPAPLKDALYQRLWDILNGKDSSPAFAALDAKTRKQILEILQATKEGLPAYWVSTTTTASR